VTSESLILVTSNNELVVSCELDMDCWKTLG
jgi:hypothetical protein